MTRVLLSRAVPHIPNTPDTTGLHTDIEEALSDG